MPSYVDRNYFKEVAAADPKVLTRGGRCHYEPSARQYTLPLWGDEYIINWAEETITIKDTRQEMHPFFYVFVIYYLLLPNDLKPKGDWISEKDLPGGVTFFRGPHLLPTDIIGERFGNNLQSFHNRCKSLGGTPVAMADAAYRFEIAHDLAVVVLYWLGDEDFPAEAKVLYDRSIIGVLPLDIVFSLAYAICERVGGAC